MKRYQKIFIALLVLLLIIITSWPIIPLRYKQLAFSIFLVFVCPAILVWIPCKVLRLQGREARLSAEIGFIVGGIVGFYVGVKVVDFIMNVIYGNMSKYSIRLDLLIGGGLGASIFSSIGAVVGGRISRRRNDKK